MSYCGLYIEHKIYVTRLLIVVFANLIIHDHEFDIYIYIYI